MSYYGAYLIGSNTLRLYNLAFFKSSTQWLETNLYPYPHSWTPSTLQERMNKVFKKIGNKINCLVLVNSTQLTADLLRAAYECATKFAHKVFIISGTLSKLQWAITETKLHYLEDKALIIYVSNNIYEFNVLDITFPTKFVLQSVERCQSYSFAETLRKLNNKNKLEAVIVVSTKKWEKENQSIKNVIQKECPRSSFYYKRENLEFIMLDGALAKVAAYFDNENAESVYIQDFSIGYKIEYANNKGQFSQSLIPFNESLPVTATVNLFEINSFRIRYNEDIVLFPTATPPNVSSGYLKSSIIHESNDGGNVKIVASIDKHGVPRIDIQKIPNSLNPDLKNKKSSDQMKFVIKLKANYGSIWLMTDGKEEYVLPNVNHHEWSPFYVSFLRQQVKIGEKGFSHWIKSPIHVLTDVHKVIGIPFEKIVQEKRDHVKIVPAGDGFGNYEVPSDEVSFLIPPEAIMSMFLMALKRIAETDFEMVVDKISVELSSNDYKFEQIPFIEKAASRAGIKVESIKLA